MPTGAVLYIRWDAGEERFKVLVEDEARDWDPTIGPNFAAICDLREDACLQLLTLAKKLIHAVDRDNWTHIGRRAHIQIGIAAGEIESPRHPMLSKPFSRAKKQAERAANEEILVDDAVRKSVNIPPFHFELKASGIFRFRVERLLKSAPADFVGNGLVALYPDRKSLLKDLTVARIMALAVEGSEVLVAGRTLVSWSGHIEELRSIARSKRVRFRFLLSSLKSISVFSADEQKDIAENLPNCLEAFHDLASSPGLSQYFDVRQTEQAVVDGLTCLSAIIPGSEGLKALLVIQDVNAAPKDLKPALVFACTNASKQEKDTKECGCMAHGLLRRSQARFAGASSIEFHAYPLSKSSSLNEGLSARRSAPRDYAGLLPPYFDAIGKQAYRQSPPPVAVQIQVTGKCSTKCVMCTHHKEGQLGPHQNEWADAFHDLYDAGVRNCVFSGGEPLTRSDIDALIHNAKRAKLNIGLLTNGTMEHDEPTRNRILSTIKDKVSWVAVSVDGAAAEDGRIRNPLKMLEEDRVNRLKEFAKYFRDSLSTERFKTFLSATVTLQKKNIGSDLRQICDFIHNSIGIPQVNFKLATAAHGAVTSSPAYLLDSADLKQLEHFLWHSSLPYEEGNNLAYLRRTFARGVFDIDSAANGAPLRSFYSSSSFRCFVPWLFALIDHNGDVYPCCHLYRDNHGSDPTSQAIKSKHVLGNVLNAPKQSFGEIWNGPRFAEKRLQLEVIKPAEIERNDFRPCGECTRYCQHNIALKELFENYQKDQHALDSFHTSPGGVWL